MIVNLLDDAKKIDKIKKGVILSSKARRSKDFDFVSINQTVRQNESFICFTVFYLRR
jgi:hypothetical protein